MYPCVDVCTWLFLHMHVMINDLHSVLSLHWCTVCMLGFRWKCVVCIGGGNSGMHQKPRKNSPCPTYQPLLSIMAKLRNKRLDAAVENQCFANLTNQAASLAAKDEADEDHVWPDRCHIFTFLCNICIVTDLSKEGIYMVAIFYLLGSICDFTFRND